MFKHSKLAVGVTVVGTLLLTSPAAQARPLDSGSYQEVIVDNGLEDYCHVDGLAPLTVDRIEDYTWKRYSLKTKGSDQLAYYWENFHYDVTRTNTANGKQVNTIGDARTKDVKVVDNGDGTMTVTSLVTVVERTYDKDGELLASGSGMYSFWTIVDEEGEWLDGDLLKDVGHYTYPEDFCVLVHEVMS